MNKSHKLNTAHRKGKTINIAPSKVISQEGAVSGSDAWLHPEISDEANEWVADKITQYITAAHRAGRKLSKEQIDSKIEFFLAEFYQDK